MTTDYPGRNRWFLWEISFCAKKLFNRNSRRLRDLIPTTLLDGPQFSPKTRRSGQDDRRLIKFIIIITVCVCALCLVHGMLCMLVIISKTPWKKSKRKCDTFMHPLVRAWHQPYRADELRWTQTYSDKNELHAAHAMPTNVYRVIWVLQHHHTTSAHSI